MTVTSAFLGTIVEYYDYSLYAFSANVIAAKFFPQYEKITALTYVFAVYAVSYFAKPLGALFFSKIGDSYGRRVALRITMLGIALPTLIIGLLPEYNSIGVISTYILLFCRFMQGFFVAGEYDGAAIYVIEHLGKKYHYTASAVTRATGATGLLLSIAVTNFFNSSIFPDFAWRIPFLLSMPLAMLTFYYRKYLEETPDFKETKKKNIVLKKGMLNFITKQWFNLLLVIFLAGGFGVTYQISVIFMKQYLPKVIVDTSTIMTAFSTFVVFCFGFSMVIAGLLADRIGIKLVIKSCLVTTIIAIVMLTTGIIYQLVNLALSAWILLAVSVAPFNALGHGVIVRLFPVNERYRGSNIGHTVGSMLMSGTANVVCLSGMTFFDFYLFPMIYIGVFAILASVMVMYMIKQHIMD
ncbi:MAG: MFS transporter [Rickettsiaceae bacterium]|nr:MFS transporter [Rickettsiaceae bacterium]